MPSAPHILAFLLLFLTAHARLAGEAVAQRGQGNALAQELIATAVNPDTDYTKPGRTKFVRLLATYCREVLNELPTNTPSEDAWVADEGRTTDTAKGARLFSSREFARYELKSVFSTCDETTKKLIQVQDSQRTDVIIRYEAANLISLAANFNNSGDIEIYATRVGLSLSSEKLGFDFLGSVRRALLFAALRTLENK